METIGRISFPFADIWKMQRFDLESEKNWLLNSQCFLEWGKLILLCSQKQPPGSHYKYLIFWLKLNNIKNFWKWHSISNNGLYLNARLQINHFIVKRRINLAGRKRFRSYFCSRSGKKYLQGGLMSYFS